MIVNLFAFITLACALFGIWLLSVEFNWITLIVLINNIVLLGSILTTEST